MLDVFENITDNEIKNIEELVDIAIENMSYEIWYYEEKYYKAGFADGVKLMRHLFDKITGSFLPSLCYVNSKRFSVI